MIRKKASQKTLNFEEEAGDHTLLLSFKNNFPMFPLFRVSFEELKCFYSHSHKMFDHLFLFVSVHAIF